MITLTINGQDRNIEKPMTVEEYIHSLGMDTKFVAVAHNGEVLDRAQFSEIMLRPGDNVEIVRPVGGG